MSYIGSGPISTRISNVDINQFDEMNTFTRRNQIQLKSSYGLSRLRNNWAHSSGFVGDQISGELTVSTSGGYPNAWAKLESAEFGKYAPGYVSEATIGLRLGGPFNDNVTKANVTWGLFNENNGIGFGYNQGSGLYIWYRKNGVDTTITSGNWNGAIPNFETSRGHIFRIRYAWYGYGQIEWMMNERINNIPGVTDDSSTVRLKLHDYIPASGTSISQPNLPLTLAISNNGELSSSGVAYVTGRTYSVLGLEVPESRITSDRRINQASITSSAFVPAISFRRKNGFTQNIRIQGIDIISTEDVLVQVRVNASLSTPSWITPQDHMAGETALQSDISSTSISGGLIVYQALIQASTKQSSNASQLDIPIDIPSTANVAVCLRAVSTTATVTTIFRVKEDW